MNNPRLILQTLDHHLDHTVELTLYGRAALALGFPSSHERQHETTQDVDAIIPLVQLEPLRADAQFWEARDATNAELAGRGPIRNASVHRSGCVSLAGLAGSPSADP